ncbi:MAG: nucleotidyltransferase domain-containing protein [Candidatus Aenigmatarchaeota archaeon]|nr:nucleotidyltransferase domain-containing protein [Candidatus Aenigmarchaeota archaeon]
MKKIEILEKIYLNPGIHLREIARRTGLSIPAVKNHIDKFLREKVITKKKEGRNVKFFINFKSRKIIPYLSEVETFRLEKLPERVGNAVVDLLSILENKPLVTIIFGSYAKDDYTKESDLDILLVFNKIDREIEEKTKLICSRYYLKVRPVYLSWKEFKEKFFDTKNVFMREIRENKLIVNGIEYWVMLENEKA